MTRRGGTPRSAHAGARGDGALLVSAVAFACTCAYTSAVAIRERLPGRPLRVSVPLSVPVGVLVGWGAAVAAPWPMPVAALVAATRAREGPRGARAALVAAGVGIAGVIGLLMEPNTYDLGAHSRANRRAIVLGFATTGALAMTGLRRRRAVQGATVGAREPALVRPRRVRARARQPRGSWPARRSR